MSKSDYTPTIGIETHVQLKTKTKLFAAVGNDAREAAPNTLISHICVGMPGALPVLNEAAIELTAKAAFALNTEPQKFSKFDRKHYFYPDLPKGYQITQYDQPLIVGGHVEIDVDGQKKKINITRAHLEEDAGKNIHPEGADYSLVDLNRAGTPLLEIVSEPEIHSAAEAKAYARELWLTMKYAEVTEGDLYHGHTRFDVNVSVSKDPAKPGIRAEIKNLNSFRSVENAVVYEIERQIELLEKGEKVVQETRGWDEAKQKTTTQREKEEANDYRYFPDPDIPPVELDNEYIDRIKSQLSELPNSIREKLGMLNIDKQVVEDLLDRPNLARAVVAIAENGKPQDASRAAFWYLKYADKSFIATEEDLINNPRIGLNKVTTLSGMLTDNKLNTNAADLIFATMLEKDINPEVEAKEKDLIQVSDEGEIEKIVSEVLDENPKAAEDIKKGEMKAIGFLVGQVMKKSQGKANPQMAQQLIKKQLGI
jgi:aspartyl-tRNA(Asn)/glutamyl-tRNA(Gln) amidotransferase subunit B